MACKTFLNVLKCLLIPAVVALIVSTSVLIWLNTQRTPPCPAHQVNSDRPVIHNERSVVFADLTQEEILQDLVAWVTTGFLHIPHAEDIPNTVTVGNGGGVLLRPHNYFDEDLSIHSADGVYFAPGTEESCDNNKMACLSQETCSPVMDPFTYHGFK